MNTQNKIVLFGGLSIIAVVMFLIFQDFTAPDPTRLVDDPARYTELIQSARVSKNRFLKQDPNSPVPDSLRKSFDSIPFYPIDHKFQVLGTYEPLPEELAANPPAIQPPGSKVPMITAGYLTVELDGEAYKLTVFWTNPGTADRRIYLPFRDATTNKGTYGGGRLIDTRIGEDDRAVVDFNLAYNPFCVYNVNFACPVPPEENRLPIAITAGEKDFSLYP